MRMSGIEDWALASTLVFALAFTATIDQARHAGAMAAPRVAAADQAPQFFMTITAKRLPAACKGTDAATNAVYCATFLEADAVVEMRETATAYAERNGAVDAERLVENK